MKLKLGAMTLLCSLSPLHFALAQNAARPETIASEKLEKLISDYEGASGDTRYVLLQRIAGDGSPRAIDFLLGICRDEAARDRIDTISLTAPLLTNHASVKTAFVELLDDPGVVEEVVFHLVSTLEPDLLKEVARRWPVEKAPAWAFRASSRSICCQPTRECRPRHMKSMGK